MWPLYGTSAPNIQPRQPPQHQNLTPNLFYSISPSFRNSQSRYHGSVVLPYPAQSSSDIPIAPSPDWSCRFHFQIDFTQYPAHSVPPSGRSCRFPSQLTLPSIPLAQFRRPADPTDSLPKLTFTEYPTRSVQPSDRSCW